MKSTERKELKGRNPRGGVSPYGWWAILLGSAYMVLGLASYFLMKEFTPFVFVPICLALGGFIVYFYGVKYLRAARRRKLLIESRPWEPWYADYPWSPRGTRSENLQRLVTGFMGSAFALIFIVPLNGLAFWAEGGVDRVAALFVVPFDIAVAAGLFWSLILLIRFVKHGWSYLRFDEFPFFLGEKLVATLYSPRRFRAAQEIILFLRCVEEVREARQMTDETELRVTPYQIYEETIEVAPPEGDFTGQFQIALTLPEGDYTTRLSHHPPRYWELEAQQGTSLLAYKSTFLIPVYTRPAA